MTTPLDLDELRRTHVRCVLSDCPWRTHPHCNSHDDRDEWPCEKSQLLGLLAERTEDWENLREELKSAGQEYQKLEARLEQAQAALERYGTHDTFNGESACDKTCVCGFSTAFEETK